jgi:serine/threonine protein phosphatase PrpC
MQNPCNLSAIKLILSIIMGTCCFSHANMLSDTLSYSNTQTIKVKEKDLRGKTITFEKISFKLPSPVVLLSEVFEMEKTTLKSSGCTLPSVDPRGLISKDCQDDFTILTATDLFLIGLFDGHGKDGRKVVNFCKKFIKNFFEANLESFRTETETALKEVIVECDVKIRESLEINCTTSGCTAILLVFFNDHFHVASVGDSRAVLATVPSHKVPEERVLVKDNRFFRMVEPVRSLHSFTLSVDQKPNMEEEFSRIVQAGGVVQQFSDNFGLKFGPFRVFDSSGLFPGLAMSRSIGDSIGKKVGVISEPIYHCFPFQTFRDIFFVIGSDGLWDVMENIEVVNFVENFRKKAKSDLMEYPASLNNSSISRLLAEEARFRWLGLCEEEDVCVDDISCVVVEIFPKDVVPVELPQVEKRKNIPKSIFASIEQTKEFKSGVLRGDLIRGSFIPSVNEKAEGFQRFTS